MEQRKFNIVTKKELLKRAERTFQKCLKTFKNKNDDYSTRDENEDGLRNFRRVEELGVARAENGVYVRLTDKMMRISNFLETGALSVDDEKIDDTIEDAINYLVILKEVINSYKNVVDHPRTKYPNVPNVEVHKIDGNLADHARTDPGYLKFKGPRLTPFLHIKGKEFVLSDGRPAKVLVRFGTEDDPNALQIDFPAEHREFAEQSGILEAVEDIAEQFIMMPLLERHREELEVMVNEAYSQMLRSYAGKWPVDVTECKQDLDLKWEKLVNEHEDN